MQPEKSKSEQIREKQNALRDLARQLAPNTPDRSPPELDERKNVVNDPWTLRRIDRLEVGNTHLQLRVERLEQPAESVTPRYPHDVRPSREEMREFLRRTGWYRAAVRL